MNSATPSMATRIILSLLFIAAVIVVFIVRSNRHAQDLPSTKKEIVGYWVKIWTPPAYTGLTDPKYTATMTYTFRADGISTLLNSLPASSTSLATSVGSDDTYTLSDGGAAGVILTTKEVDRIYDGKRIPFDYGTKGEVRKSYILVDGDTLTIIIGPLKRVVYRRQVSPPQ